MKRFFGYFFGILAAFATFAAVVILPTVAMVHAGLEWAAFCYVLVVAAAVMAAGAL